MPNSNGLLPSIRFPDRAKAQLGQSPSSFRNIDKVDNSAALLPGFDSGDPSLTDATRQIRIVHDMRLVRLARHSTLAKQFWRRYASIVTVGSHCSAHTAPLSVITKPFQISGESGGF